MSPAARRPRFFDRADTASKAALEALALGLRAAAASIPPKYFYDALGSALFPAICELPEYYPTRTEAAIVAAHRADIAASVGRGATLIDLGAGDCAKAERLFDALQPSQYVAVDISAAFLATALEALQDRHPELDVVGVGTDFTRALELPEAISVARRVFLYPGSSIGNFTPDEARAFLSRVRASTDPQGGLLIGVDLAKPAELVVPAYDDALGVTAAFNLNVLRHVNRLLGADFDVRDWRHVALLNEAESRIEMHLEARRAVSVRWPGMERRFEAGERIHTENSYKYAPGAFERLLSDAGYRPTATWTDPRGMFAVVHAVPAD